jgi:hypothetical protein
VVSAALLQSPAPISAPMRRGTRDGNDSHRRGEEGQGNGATVLPRQCLLLSVLGVPRIFPMPIERGQDLVVEKCCGDVLSCAKRRVAEGYQSLSGSVKRWRPGERRC